MSITSVNDMLIRFKNARRRGRSSVAVPFSKFRFEMAKVLERMGYVAGIERKGKRARRMLEISFKEGTPSFSDVRLLSRPSRRLYVPHRELKPSTRGGIVIVSTSKGLLESREARKARVGGELIAEVW